MNDSDKVLTYEDAKQLCMKAFDGGATYGSESMRYGVNAVAYDWEHWLKKNESLFRPKPTVEDVQESVKRLMTQRDERLARAEAENAKLRELVRDMWSDGMCECDERGACAECEYHFPDRMRELGVEE